MPRRNRHASKKPQIAIRAGDRSIAIGGDAVNSIISTGDNATITQIQQIIEKQTASALFTIPAPVIDFTGREKELADLKAAFSHGAIITGVTGGGGIGKTELARKLAQEIADGYPDARLSIDLLGTSENPLAPEEAMRRLLEPFYPNQKLPDDPAQLKGLFQQTFAAQKSLLLLDNAANAAQVRPLIPPAPSATIITSRLHFGLTEFGLNPLRLDVLSETEAVELLRMASLKLKEATDDEVTVLAALCGRLPLALRVAASLLDDSANWTPSTLISRLTDERTRLGRLRRDNDHDLDVEATLSLSYQLLSEELKKYFRLVSVFTAPFVMQSAKAVWGLEEDGGALDLLDKLVNRSLLNFLAEGAGYYSLHDLTRFFGFEKLLENAVEAENVIMAHANHFLEWASEADNLYLKGNENILLGLAQFRFIWPHLNTAYERLLPGQKNLPRPETADEWLNNFPGKCAYVLDLYLPPRQRIPILQTALEAARRLGEKQAEGVYLGNLGLAYAALGDARKAIEFYEQALKVMQEIGDKRAEGSILGNLGSAYAALGDARKAIEFYEQYLSIAREIGDRRGEGNALQGFGISYAALGDARKAIEFYEKQLVIVREIGDRRGEGADLGNLGIAYKNLGEARKAIEYHEQALKVMQEIGDRRGEGAVLGNLGIAYKNLGEARKAIEYHEQALVIDREIGDRRGEGNDLGNLGLAYKSLGETAKTRILWQQALSIFRAIESPNAQVVQKWLDDLE